jgi:hypothetical protein
MADEALKKKIVERVKQGKTVEEIKNEFDLKSVVTVKNMYMEGLVDSGEIPPLKKSETRPRKIDVRTIGKTGATLPHKLLVDMLGFKQGDRFKVKRENDNIVLEKV